MIVTFRGRMVELEIEVTDDGSDFEITTAHYLSTNEPLAVDTFDKLLSECREEIYEQHENTSSCLNEY